MSFKTQKLANYFPDWTKVRRDPSSMGARFLSVFADYLEYSDAELVKIREEFDLLKYALGIGAIYSIDLTAADAVTSSSGPGGVRVWNYPTTVTGTHPILGVLALARVETFEDLLWSVPSRLTEEETVAVSDFLIYDSTVGTIVVMDVIERLTIVISNSTTYYPKSSIRNRRASGQHFVKLVGRDRNYIEIEEVITTRDDGVYTSKNAFSSLSEVSFDGFDGRVQLYIATAPDHLFDRFRVGISDKVQGPLKIRPSTYNYLGTDMARMHYFTDIMKLGTAYRTGGTPEDNEDEIWDQILLDSSSNYYVPVGIAIHPDSTRLYCIDDTGFLHIYEHGPSTFTPPSDPDVLTLVSYIDILPLKHWALLGERIKLFTYFRKPTKPIANVIIKRISPTSVIRYLQANLTWGAGTYSFVTTDTQTILPAATWTDLTFEFTPDELGEWEFYITTQTTEDTTTTTTKVMVDALDALVSIDTGVVNPTALLFSEDGRLMVASAAVVTYFVENGDDYFVDGNNQQIFLREEYDAVEVTI